MYELLQLIQEFKYLLFQYFVKIHPLGGWHILFCPKDFHRDFKIVSSPAFLYEQGSRWFRGK